MNKPFIENKIIFVWKLLKKNVEAFRIILWLGIW